ncbi:hypothetical protein TNCV_214821 [Trichonephila clavipes]|nr:hypothetical protein TNCV_214821 [Trichonephila clavipes]
MICLCVSLTHLTSSPTPVQLLPWKQDLPIRTHLLQRDCSEAPTIDEIRAKLETEWNDLFLSFIQIKFDSMFNEL